MRSLERLCGLMQEQGYETLVVFDQDGVVHVQGQPVSFDEYHQLFEKRENRVLKVFENPARVSFHGPYGLLWIRADFNDEYAMHLNMVDLALENERLKRLEGFYYRMVQEMGRISETGILVVDGNNRPLYVNDEAEMIDLPAFAREEMQHNQGASLQVDELIRDFPSHKIFRRGLPGGMGTLLYSKQQGGEREKGQAQSTAVPLEHKIIGQTAHMEEIMGTIKKISPTDSTVLIRGESGTGKEGFAKLIHDRSLRKDQPFIAINCASIPEHLLESELFGYAKGSFTGALKGGKIGKFEAANKGTLFLDEIGDMSWNLQAKILRVLEEKVIEKVGGTQPIKVDVRIISATHQNLENMIMKKQFRKDLFYRLNVIPIHIPPLRERIEDIENLVHYYIKKNCVINSRSFMTPSRNVIRRLKDYAWPGNIRELINVVEYIVSTEEGEVITESMLPREIVNVKKTVEPDREVYKAVEASVKRHAKPRKPNRAELLELLDTFGYSSENKKELAKHLDISTATLYRWLKKFEIT